MKKVKVAHLITKLELGGAQRNTLHTVAHLDPERFVPVLISGRGGILDREAMAAGFPMHFALSLVRPIRPWKDWSALRELIFFLREERPAIVHTHSSKAGLLGRLAAWIAGVPKVVHSFHGFAFHPGQPWWLRWHYVVLEKIFARFADKLIFVSEANRDQARRLGIGKESQFELIRSGIDLEAVRSIKPLTLEEREQNGIPATAPLVVSVGNLKPQKNPLGFVRVARNVLKRVPEAHFVFIGDGELRAEVERRLKEAGLEKNVHFPGWLEEPKRWVASADVFAMSSLWEGLPRSLVEAMVLGRACACYAADGVPDILKERETGRLIPLGDEAGLSRAITALLMEPDERLSLGKAAAAAIGQEFDIDGMVRSQEKLYETLLAQKT